jgi:hypothetical protein
MSAQSKLWVALSAAVVFALGASVMAAAPGGGGGGPGPGAGGPPMGGRNGGRGGGAPAGLGQAMTDMGAMLTKIKQEATDDTKSEQTMKDLAQFERDVAIAKMQNPPTGKVDADKKDKAPEDFRAAMTVLQHTLLDLEDAVAAKKPDDINKCIAKLSDTEKAGHAEFKVGQ